MSVRVDQALTADFIEQAFGLPIAHENVNYTPTQGTPYVELRVLQNATLPFDVASHDDMTGVFQFILRYPEGNGAIPAKAMAELVFDAYPIARKITYGGLDVYVTGRARPTANPEDGWYKVTGQILFRALSER